MSVQKILAVTTVSALTATGLITASAAAAPASPTAGCVNKQTNELRVLLKASKKCKKGWQKITFNQPGPPGAPGSAGAAGPVSVVSVKDATGAVIGQSLNSIGTWLSGSALVYTEGGAYSYNLGTGKVVSDDWESVAYLDASCSPTNAAAPVYNTRRYLAALTSFGRMVDRPNTDLPTRAFRGTTTVRAVVPGESFWYREATGACTQYTPWNDTIAMLTPVAAPADRPGPLSLG